MKRLLFCFSVLGLLTLAVGGAGSAEVGYPTIASAGFHHCALIYHRASRSADDLKPYVARYVNGKPTSDWLFDAFLFLAQSTASGKRTEVDATDKNDWLSILDRWFGPRRDLSALDDALTQTAQAQGLYGPPSKRKIILCIPWISPSVKSFGDVDGDGKSEDLSTSEGRRTVIRWYLEEVHRRFADAKFRNLELWGLYRMREDVAGDEETISMISEEVHSRGEKLLWIPYFRAPGWEKWRDYGIDVAILQPNYAFRNWLDGGNAKRNRLAACADMARSHGLGVEIEARGYAPSDFERRMFMQYLCDGAKNRYGYQDVPTAYYLCEDAIDAWYNDAKSRGKYDALCDYIVGKPIKDPDQKCVWKWTKSGNAKLLLASTVLPSRQYVSSIDVFFDDPSAGYWRGIVSAEIKAGRGAKWKPCGWTIRGNVDSSEGKHQVITLPVRANASELMLIFQPQTGSPSLDITGIAVNPEGPAIAESLALGRGYTFSPARPTPPYGDDGLKLTDGVISTNGSLSDGKTVGWFLHEDYASIAFDLGRSVPVSGIEMYTRGGGVSAIEWPGSPVALLSPDQPIPGMSGAGVHPSGVSVLSGSQPVVDRKRSDSDMDGHITFPAAKVIPARYVTVLGKGPGWVMCSEIRVLSNGKNVLSESTPYVVSPQPSYRDDVRYADDGRKLTDGIIAQRFEPRMLAGWEDDGVREIVVDLGKVQAVHKLTAWSLGGGGHGILAPKSVVFSTSIDGTTWSDDSLASPGPEPKAGMSRALPYTSVLGSGVRGRYVRVSVTRSQGWAMLSEISVE